MSKESSSNGFGGLALLVFAVFLTLKLTDVSPIAEWSWWWVTSPLWICLALSAIFSLLAILFVGGMAIAVTKKAKDVINEEPTYQKSKFQERYLRSLEKSKKE